MRRAWIDFGDTGRALSALLFLACVMMGCEGTAAPPNALVRVQTDLPLSLANRLRVDLFRDDGTWFTSRDFALPNASDWPASFGVDSARPVFARVRVYPEGLVRDYTGERYSSNDKPREPPGATSLTKMCDRATELHLGRPAVVRRIPSPDVWLDFGPCGSDLGGTAAAYVDIPEAGRYTVGALATNPPATTFAAGSFYRQVTLELRAACESNGDVCDRGGAKLPVITRSLPAGRLFIVVGGDTNNPPVDVTIVVTHEGEWPLLWSKNPAL